MSDREAGQIKPWDSDARKPGLDLYPVVRVPSAPTWDDIVQLSYHEPVLHHIVTLVSMPYSNISREQGLTMAVFALYNAKAAMFQREVDRVNTEPNPRWVMPDPRQPLE